MNEKNATVLHGCTTQGWKRALCMLLVLLSLVGVLPVDILAADIWDGVGGGKIILDKYEQLFYNVATIIFRHILA